MTMSHDERQRLAAMGQALRPDWRAGSLFTLITDHLQHRTYQATALALAFIATDPSTNTPGRLKEDGPWWEASRPAGLVAPHGAGRCPKCDVFHTPQSPCNVREIRADRRRHGPAMVRAALRVQQGGPAPEQSEEGN